MLTKLCRHLSSSELLACADPEGGGRILTSLKNHKNIGFLVNTGPDPLKNHKSTKPAFNGGPSSARQRNVSRRWPDFSCIWIHSLTKKKLGPSEKNFLDPRMVGISQCCAVVNDNSFVCMQTGRTLVRLYHGCKNSER